MVDNWRGNRQVIIYSHSRATGKCKLYFLGRYGFGLIQPAQLGHRLYSAKKLNGEKQLKRTKKLGFTGQDLVEFAIVLPFLLLVVFGIFDLGRLFHAGITITSAAREGARFGTRNKEATDGEIRTATRNEALNSGIDISSATIDIKYLDILPLSSQDGDDDTIRVRISYDFDFIIDNFWSITDIQIVRHAEMRLR